MLADVVKNRPTAIDMYLPEGNDPEMVRRSPEIFRCPNPEIENCPVARFAHTKQSRTDCLSNSVIARIKPVVFVSQQEDV